MRRILALIGLAGALLVCGYLAYWYGTARYPSGVYPARLGGVIFAEEPNPALILPVVWVRAYPWERVPPTLTNVTLHFADGQKYQLTGEITLDLDKSRGASSAPRLAYGKFRLDIPKGESVLVATTIQIQGRPPQRFANGPVVLVTDADGKSELTVRHVFDQWVPSLVPLGPRLGHYIQVEGTGMLEDVISSIAGVSFPVTGLMYKDGYIDPSGLMRLIYETDGFQPLTLPVKVEGAMTIYVPIPPAAWDGLRRTYYNYQHAILIKKPGGGCQVVRGREIHEYGFVRATDAREQAAAFVFDEGETGAVLAIVPWRSKCLGYAEG